MNSELSSAGNREGRSEVESENPAAGIPPPLQANLLCCCGLWSVHDECACWVRPGETNRETDRGERERQKKRNWYQATEPPIVTKVGPTNRRRSLISAFNKHKILITVVSLQPQLQWHIVVYKLQTANNSSPLVTAVYLIREVRWTHCRMQCPGYYTTWIFCMGDSRRLSWLTSCLAPG